MRKCQWPMEEYFESHKLILKNSTLVLAQERFWSGFVTRKYHKWLDHSDSKCGKTQPYHTLFHENSWIKSKWHFVFSIFICVCEFVIWKWWGIEVWKISNWTLQDIWKSWTYEKWKNYQNILEGFACPDVRYGPNSFLQ